MILDWLAENTLSMYGAIVGTWALYLNFTKTRRKLIVSSYVDEGAQKQLNRVADKIESEDMLGNRIDSSPPFVGPVYRVEVVNTCYQAMYIKQVGVEMRSLKKNIQITAEVLKQGSLKSVGDDMLQPGCSQQYYIYLDGKKPQLEQVVSCYVVDHLGKTYKGKHSQKKKLNCPLSSKAIQTV
ncbi:hypothetical protein F0249_07815 [Vibrio sp. 03-59-1]|uniref:hypothetical protein n=1 Tax=Vibrio sp. 03-59-1 TaxID=2607607 RepID=UPI0014937134|nr:hypothetical protein [Vibrio sp. 03-59-1]NOH83716.1 hypothetical protein [Vibrio sp. 03-59-1]